MKNVLICGAGKAGIAAAKLAKRNGLKVTVSDNQKEENLLDIKKDLEENDIHTIFGKNPTELPFDGIILSPGIPTTLPFIKKARQKGIPVMGEIEFAYGYTKANFLAITGTNGKTTTASLLHHIIKEDVSSHLLGNVGISLSGAADKIDKDEYIVLELSSFQLETMKTFHPKVAALLNLTPDHLNRHETMEKYGEIKASIFKNQEAEDFAILNYDDAFTRNLEVPSHSLFFSLNVLPDGLEGAFVNDGIITIRKDGEEILVLDETRLPIVGKHNLYNAMAAILMALAIQIPLESIQQGLMTFEAVPHRMEPVETIDGVVYYNDSKATNVDAAVTALLSLQEPIVLIAGGEAKGTPFDEWAAQFRGNVKELILLGETADEIEKKARENDFHHIHRVETIEEAVKKSHELAESGDAVLLSPACASWDMFSSFEERGDLFKQAVHDLGD